MNIREIPGVPEFVTGMEKFIIDVLRKVRAKPSILVDSVKPNRLSGKGTILGL